MADIRDLIAEEVAGLPADITVNLTTDEFVIVCRQLCSIGQRDPRREHAESAFAKLLQGARASKVGENGIEAGKTYRLNAKGKPEAV